MKITELKKFFENEFKSHIDRKTSVFHPFIFVDVPPKAVTPVELTAQDREKLGMAIDDPIPKVSRFCQVIYLEYRGEIDNNDERKVYTIEDWEKAPTVAIDHNSVRVTVPLIQAVNTDPSLNVEMKWPFADGFFRFFMPIAAFKVIEDQRKFTDPEMEWLEGHPDALELVADYHDLQMTQGEPMGFDCSGNQKRYDELKERAGTIRAAWENGDKI